MCTILFYISHLSMLESNAQIVDCDTESHTSSNHTILLYTCITLCVPLHSYIRACVRNWCACACVRPADIEKRSQSRARVVTTFYLSALQRGRKHATRCIHTHAGCSPAWTRVWVRQNATRGVFFCGVYCAACHTIWFSTICTWCLLFCISAA